jgi:pilus assembly protein Flp/PilA
MKRITGIVRAFAAEEDGAALTEYIVLLGILVGGVIGAVTLFGENLNTVWQSWADWVSSVPGAPS